MTETWDLTVAQERRRDWYSVVARIAAGTRIPPNPARRRLTRDLKRARIACMARSHMARLLRHQELTDRALVAETIRLITVK